MSSESEAANALERPSSVVRISWPSGNSLIAYAMVALAVVWRTWAVLRLSFQSDDWIVASRAARIPLLRFILPGSVPSDHLITGQLILAWIASRIAPLNYGVAVAPLLVGSVVAGVLMWRFLAALFGDRPENLVLLAVFLLCPLSVPPFMWWASSLAMVPIQLFIVGALFAVLRYVRAPSRGRLLAVALAYAGALLFWEKGLLILPLAVLFVALYLGEGSGRGRLRQVAVARWPLWAAFGALTVPYVAWFLSVKSGVLAGRPSMAAIRGLASLFVGSTFVPTSLGGPWRVSPLLGPGVISPLPNAARVFTWIVFAGIVVVSLVRRRQAWRAWALLTGYLSMCVGLVVLGRLSSLGLIAGLTPRYLADAVPVLAVALGLAFMVPLDRRGDPRWTQGLVDLRLEASAPSERTRADLTAGSRAGQAAGAAGSGVLGIPRKTLALALVLLYAFSALITGWRVADEEVKTSAKAWLANARADLGRYPTASIFTTSLPKYSISAFSAEGQDPASVLSPIAPHVRWNGPAEHPLVFDDEGHLLPVQVDPITSSVPGPLVGCGYLVGQTTVSTRLQQPLIFGTYAVHLKYHSGGHSIGYVAIDRVRQWVSFAPGFRDLFLYHVGIATSLTIQVNQGQVCVTDIEAGAFKPSPVSG